MRTDAESLWRMTTLPQPAKRKLGKLEGWTWLKRRSYAATATALR
jgi:hypothetical protein